MRCGQVHHQCCCHRLIHHWLFAPKCWCRWDNNNQPVQWWYHGQTANHGRTANQWQCHHHSNSAQVGFAKAAPAGCWLRKRSGNSTHGKSPKKLTINKTWWWGQQHQQLKWYWQQWSDNTGKIKKNTLNNNQPKARDAATAAEAAIPVVQQQEVTIIFCKRLTLWYLLWSSTNWY